MAHRAYRFVVKNNECYLCRIAAALHPTGKGFDYSKPAMWAKGNPWRGKKPIFLHWLQSGKPYGSKK